MYKSKHVGAAKMCLERHYIMTVRECLKVRRNGVTASALHRAGEFGEVDVTFIRIMKRTEVDCVIYDAKDEESLCEGDNDVRGMLTEMLQEAMGESHDRDDVASVATLVCDELESDG